jgi:hypothetical protein
MTPIRSDSVCKERRHTDDDSLLDKQKQGTSKVAAFIYTVTRPLSFSVNFVIRLFFLSLSRFVCLFFRLEFILKKNKT